MTLQVLEEFLQHFPGVVVVVSHDRYFMDKIVEHVFVLGEGDKIRDFPGNYTDYRMAREQEIQNAKNDSSSQKTELKTEQKSKAMASQEDRKELKRIEKQIQKLEEDKSKITQQFNNAELSSDKIMELSKQLQILQSDLEDKEMRWLELSELM
jgi:ATP-binding cassette subfamily F protein uup